MIRFLFKSLLLVAVLAAAVAGAAAWWINQPLDISAPGGAPAGGGAATVDLSIEPGISAKAVAQLVAQSGVAVDPTLLYAWFRLSGDARRIKAGSYELQAGLTPKSLLEKLVQGDEVMERITLVEGSTFRQFLEVLSKEELLTHSARGLSDEMIMEKLGKPGLHPEGRFFPDTYAFARGSSDLHVLERAMRAMNKQLEAAWARKSADSPLKSADEALILASIVEKETGAAADRPMVASVFANRLRIGMLLQTDPTVIYGMGARFDGNLRKKDLQTDTPWNTYTRAGLPPTPIAMPGKASLLAAVAPPPSKALYFVARGDGSSQFSDSLGAHNRAVNKFQRNQK